ncbi:MULTISPECIES: hypothetical protein [Streptomyces]|uniref:hypothetical protein n=1 Tax=Streptomyces TaxID=1883 RepID=UPI001D15785C|nr:MULTISPECIES: hypothetical protein [Streptomyces]MCC3654655.1 hypothetical protein [Streptomyces sp. S07_1.15]WSQ70955.1 hypothetical protein OG463_05570 [Streptomyces xinghaiensis]
MTHSRQHRPAIAAVLTAAALMTGCQSGGAATPLSLDGLTETADGMPDDGTDTCPLPYDMGRAAKAAGLDAEAGPGPVEKSDEPVATAEGGKRAEPGDPLAVNQGVLVSCTFHIGRDDVQVHTAATREGYAVVPLAPVVSRLAAVSSDELIGYIDKAGKAKPGEAVVTGSGNVAAVRLKLDGDGDGVLVVGAGEWGKASLGRKQTGDLTQALADQVG